MTGPVGSYLMPSLYALQLRHWLRAFSINQFHIMSSKAFKVDTGTEMVQLAAFLEGQKGVSAATAMGVNEKVLESRHRTKKDSSKAKASAQLSERTDKALAQFFEPFNLELWQLVGRKIGW